MPFLSHSDARSFYDRFAEKQDRQAWYEDPALLRLAEESRFGDARYVLEFGCGTGRFAADFIYPRLAARTQYVGLDSSPEMVRLARERLHPSAARATIQLTDGSMRLPVDPARVDRFVSTYVLDLLSDRDVDMLIADMRRVLRPGGLACLAGLTSETSGLSRAVSGLWSLAQRLAPARVGGCRPMSLQAKLDPDHWRLRHRSVVSPWAVASEIIVAERLPDRASTSA